MTEPWAYRVPVVNALLDMADEEVRQHSPAYEARAVKRELARAMIIALLDCYRCDQDSIAGGMAWMRLEQLAKGEIEPDA